MDYKIYRENKKTITVDTQNSDEDANAKKDRILVVIPTYNEKENIPILVGILFQMYASRDIEILVVDDSSPDGTAQIVEALAISQPKLHLLLREKKEGLGQAYIAGFQWGLERHYTVLIEMDADFSHRPKDLAQLLEGLDAKDPQGNVKADFIIGSRYTQGGSTLNWNWFRRLLSMGGSFYSRCILGYPIKDWTAGFMAWRSGVLQDIHLESVKSSGYSFQIELKYRALKKNYRGLEVPILFEERRIGQSKMSMAIALEALCRVWFFRFHCLNKRDKRKEQNAAGPKK